MFGQPNYMGYPTYTPGYYPPPVPDQLAQMRAQQMGPGMQGMNQPAPAGGQMAAQSQQVGQQGATVIWVQDEAQARDYPVAPNSSVALWVINAPVLYLKQADASGKPSMQIYDMVERQTAVKAPQTQAQTPAVDYPTREEFDDLAAQVRALAAKRTVKVKETPKEEDQ